MTAATDTTSSAVTSTTAPPSSSSSQSPPELPEALGSEARAFISGEHRLLIGDERLPAADGATFATLDPSTGRELARVAQAGAEDVERAVAAARAAFSEGPWASMPASGRERLMLALAGAVEEQALELAQIESADNGKPVGSPSTWTSPGRSPTCATSPAGRRRSRVRCCR